MSLPQYKIDTKLGHRLRDHMVASGLETPMTDAVYNDADDKKGTIAKHVRGILETLGLDLTDDSLQDTPTRVARMYVDELFSGLNYNNFPKCTAVENKMTRGKSFLAERDITLNSSCFTGDTPVMTPAGSTLIKDLEDDTPVYSMDPTSGELQVIRCIQPKVTRRDAALVEVTIGGRRVCCTPDHQFYLEDGSAIEAKDLLPGMQLAGVERFVADNNGHPLNMLRVATSSGTPTQHKEHHLVSLQGAALPPDMVVHHKDFNPLNNDPDNLEQMTRSHHNEVHSRNRSISTGNSSKRPETRAQRATAVRASWDAMSDEERALRQLSMSDGRRIANLVKAGESPLEVAQLTKQKEERRIRILEVSAPRRAATIARRRAKAKAKGYVRQTCGLATSSFGRFLKQQLTVSGVTPLKRTEDVYCMVVPGNRTMVVGHELDRDANVLSSQDPSISRFIGYITKQCEHHLITITGLVSVAYIPAQKVLGLSKLNRIVNFFACRPAVQERTTEQIAEAIRFITESPDVIVHMNAKHFCVAARGIRDTNSYTTTLATRGIFDDPESHSRQEFLAQVN